MANKNSTFNSVFFTYDGSTNPKDFIKQFKMASLIQEWDETKQLQALPLMLEKKALDILESLQPDEKNTVEKVFVVLLKTCCQSEDVLLYQFYERKRKPNESVVKFATALRSLLVQAVPEISAMPTVLIKFLRPQLCLALPEHMRAMVTFNSTLKWDDLLNSLDRALPFIPSEAGAKQSESYNRWDTFQPTELAPTPFGSDLRSEIKTEPNQTMLAETSRRFEGDCHYCGYSGHRIAQCRGRLRDESNGIYLKSNIRVQKNQQRYDQSAKPDNREFPNKQNNSNQASKAKNNATGSFAVDDGDNDYGYFTKIENVNTDTAEFVCMNLHDSKVTELLKVRTTIQVLNNEIISTRALVDGGSTKSFIAAKLLSRKQMEIAGMAKPVGFKRANYNISGIAGIVKTTCCVVEANIIIGAWKGKHELLITDSITKHDMIIGRDFLKQHKVNVDHEDDSMSIDGTKVWVNFSSAAENIVDEEEEIEFSKPASLQEKITTLQAQLKEYATEPRVSAKRVHQV